MRNEDEYLQYVPLRIFPSVIKEIDTVLKADKEAVFENRSHFIRCAINYFLKSERVWRIWTDDKEED